VPIESGILYVVATPIGNLGDIGPRALDTLRAVDWIAAEDTRHTGRLLKYFDIDTRMMSLHEHNERQRSARIIEQLRKGLSVALVSDAGTPLISDPGYPLVRGAHEEGLRVVAVPGPSSVIAALSIFGLPTDRFVFEGFVPAKRVARRNRFAILAEETRTLVFLEASHRIQACIHDMVFVFGPERRTALVRELTKLNEETRYDTLGGLHRWVDDNPDRCRGEFVIGVHGAAERTDSSTFTADTRGLLKALLTELPVSRAVAVAAEITGLRKNVLYELALSLKNS
jgi:16S rRNA (cytidine1402-2'-O)-methyltransferase